MSESKADYKVYASLHEDIGECYVWIQSELVQLKFRSIVKITSNANGKSIYCECYKIDSNFITKYNEKPKTVKIKARDNVIVINNWYRNKLGICKSQESYNFTIKPTNSIYAQIKVNTGHPQSVARLAMRIALLSLFLGIAGLFSNLKCLH